MARTLALEEPIVKLLQENAYREVILRQRVNDAAKAVMLAYSTGETSTSSATSNTPRLVISRRMRAPFRRHRQLWKRMKTIACACRMLSKA